MSKYFLTSKEIGEHIVEWEAFYNNGIQHESLEVYIAKKQAEKMLQDLSEVSKDSIKIVVDKLLMEMK